MLSEDRKKWILLWIKNQGFTSGKILVADPERDSLFLDIKYPECTVFDKKVHSFISAHQEFLQSEGFHVLRVQRGIPLFTAPIEADVFFIFDKGEKFQYYRVLFKEDFTYGFIFWIVICLVIISLSIAAGLY